MAKHARPSVAAAPAAVRGFLECARRWFSWLAGTLSIRQLPRAQVAKVDTTSWEAPKAITSWRRGVPLELIRYAGANRLKVDVDYHAQQGRQGVR